MSPETFAIVDAISSLKSGHPFWLYLSLLSDNKLNALDKISCCVTLFLLGQFWEFLGVDAVTVLIQKKTEPMLLRFKLLVDWRAVKLSLKKDRLLK